jgi:UDP-N-acetylmuramate--alanine ligase
MEKYNEILASLNVSPQQRKDVKAAVYFLGIGGIGMSALARYFNSLGVRVSGYDKTETVLTRQLVAEGIAFITKTIPC